MARDATESNLKNEGFGVACQSDRCSSRAPSSCSTPPRSRECSGRLPPSRIHGVAASTEAGTRVCIAVVLQDCSPRRRGGRCGAMLRPPRRPRRQRQAPGVCVQTRAARGPAGATMSAGRASSRLPAVPIHKDHACMWGCRLSHPPLCSSCCAQDDGYILLASFGDQWSDLTGPNLAEANFKLPNPMYYLL